MICERWCSLHSVPLLDLVCAYQHGTKWDAKTRTRIPNFETNAWLHVEDGVVVAEVDGERIKWLRQKFDGGTRRLAGRRADGTGGRVWNIDAQQERSNEVRRESYRRTVERKRAKAEGREPEEWARPYTRGNRKPGADYRYLTPQDVNDVQEFCAPPEAQRMVSEEAEA